MRDDLVTVIVPVYNAERWLDDCLTAIARQSHAHLQVVCVDDGSTDGSHAILCHWAERDSRFEVLRQPNQGQAGARNTALAAARGLWVMMVDADDLLPADAIATLLEATADGAEMACGLFTYQWPAQQPQRLRQTTLSATGYLSRVLWQHRGYDNSICGKLMSRSLFEDSDGTSDDCAERFVFGLYYEDLEMLPRVALHANKVVHTNAVVYYYRPHDDSFIHTLSPLRLDALRASAMVEECMATRCPALVAAARSRRLSANFNIYGLLAAHPHLEWLSTARRQQIMDDCYAWICRNRAAVFCNRHATWKSRLGIMLSWLPQQQFTRLLAKKYGG